MEQKIDTINKTEYQELVDVWESSVRATHHFLKEEDIEYWVAEHKRSDFTVAVTQIWVAQHKRTDFTVGIGYSLESQQLS